MFLIDTHRWPLMPVNLLFCVYKRLTTWGKYWSMYSVCLSSLSHVNYFLHRLNYMYSNRMETTYGDIQYVKVKEKMCMLGYWKCQRPNLLTVVIISFPLISILILSVQKFHNYITATAWLWLKSKWMIVSLFIHNYITFQLFWTECHEITHLWNLFSYDSDVYAARCMHL